MTTHDQPATADRRSILGGAIGAGALGLVGAGATGLVTAGPAAAHGTITTYSGINGARTVYEVTDEGRRELAVLQAEAFEGPYL